jgi:pyruvate,water dikinase
VDFYVTKLVEGIATLAAAFYAEDTVIVRMSDFKSNEYANLIGGKLLRAGRREPHDRLPWRQGATSPTTSVTASIWNARR